MKKGKLRSNKKITIKAKHLENPQKYPSKKSLQTLNFFWQIICAICLLLGGIYSWFQIKDYFLSPEKKHEKEHFYQSILKPSSNSNTIRLPYSILEFQPKLKIIPINNHSPQIKGLYIRDYNNKHWIFVFISGYIFTCLPEDLNRGIDIFNPIFSACSGAHLYLYVKDERLYVSTEFTDLETDQSIGFIEYNHWKLFNSDKLDFNNTDEKLEVKDTQHHIVFSIEYEANLMVSISGYFISPNSIIIMPNDPKKSKSINPLCIKKEEKNWKIKALEEIFEIKTIFPEKMP